MKSLAGSSVDDNYSSVCEELPEGWSYKKLGEVILPSKEKIEPTINSNFPYIGLEHIESNSSKIVGQGIASQTKSTKTVFHAGDVLYGKLRPYLNKVVIPDFDGVCSTDILVFNQNQIIDSQYLMRYLSTREIVEYANRKSKGISLPRVSFESLAEIPIPFPSLAEQRRIVARVEALLSQVNAARDRLNRVPLVMKRFRQAVLAAACSGRLTEGWREENFEEFVSHNNAIENFSLFDIPSQWHWFLLPKLGYLKRGRSKNRPRNAPHLYGGIYPFIQTGDIAQSGGRITSHKQTYSEAGLVQSKLWPEKTVCITIAANIAESAILTYPACFPDSVVGFIADYKLCLPEYIEYFIRVSKHNLTQFAPATAQKNINIEILNEVTVPIPPFEEQQEIVRRVDTLFALADQIEQQVAVATTRTEALTQAVLAKAFRGELVSNEAEHIQTSSKTLA